MFQFDKQVSILLPFLLPLKLGFKHVSSIVDICITHQQRNFHRRFICGRIGSPRDGNISPLFSVFSPLERKDTVLSSYQPQLESQFAVPHRGERF